MDGLPSIPPATTRAAPPGERMASGPAALFAALLGALQEPVAVGTAVASPPEATNAEAVSAVAEDGLAAPGPGRAGDQPAAGDPLLVQALLAATQPGAKAAPTAKPVGKGGAAEGLQVASPAAPAGAGTPILAAAPRQGRVTPARAETEMNPKTVAETQNAAPAHGPAAVHRADPMPVDAREATNTFPHAPAMPDAPAPPRIEAASPQGVPPPTPPADPGAPGSPSPQGAMSPRPSPIHQVAQLAVALSAGGEDEDRLSIALDPAELGRVEISIERQGGSAQVRVTAERPETLALLQRDQRELDRLLGQSGIGEEGRALSFGLSADGGGAGGSDHGSRQRGDAPAPVQHAAEPEYRPILGLIDLAV